MAWFQEFAKMTKNLQKNQKIRNSNGHNSAHTEPILMNDLPLYCLREGLSNDVVFVPGHGSWPGSGLNYPVVARSEIFWCHRIEHVEKPGKRILYHINILSVHQIMLVQSFRVFHHSPGHNSAQPGPIRIILVSFESWSIALQNVHLRFSHLRTFNCRKIQKHRKKAIFEFGGP